MVCAYYCSTYYKAVRQGPRSRSHTLLITILLLLTSLLLTTFPRTGSQNEVAERVRPITGYARGAGVDNDMVQH